MSNNPFIFTFGSRTYDLESRPHIMGVLNVTPDSFSDGGKYVTLERAIGHASAMIEEGADFIDVGGESTRPGAETVPLEEERRRTLPVIEALAKKFPGTPLSIDTYKSRLASAALDAGAAIVNDISGGTFDAAMLPLCAQRNAALILMHIKGEPKTMQRDPRYADVVAEVKESLRERSAAATTAGVRAIAIDPGIGFGKTLEHNLALLRRLNEFRDLGLPILIGVSRKSFIGALLGGAPPEQRLAGTTSATAIAVANGANIVRVHDVKAMREASTIAFALARR